MKNNDDPTIKFGDFLSDDNVEFTEAEFLDNNSSQVPSYISLPTSPEPEPDEKISSAIDNLMNKLGLDVANYDPSQVLDNLDKIDSDDITFDLVASKIVSDLVSRTALKGIIVQAQMTDRIWDYLAQAYGNSASPLDADSLLLIDKATSYLDKLFAVQDRYKRAGIVQSLKHIAKQKEKENDPNKTPEEDIQLTNADIQRLVKQAQEENQNKQ